MNAKTFVEHFKKEKDWQMNDYFSDETKTVAGSIIKSMNLSEEQLEKLKLAFESSLTDTYYTILLALDGAAGIGGMQETFKIYDEKNQLVSECGDIEAEAYEQFHEN